MKRWSWTLVGLGFLLLLFSLLFVACSQGAPATAAVQEIRQVTPQEAWRLIQEHAGDPQWVVLDIRTPQEFTAGHIEGAVNIDFYASDFAKRLDALDKAKTYVLYCNSGNRSARALAMMREMGFQRVYEIQGGIQAWLAAGLPVER